MGKGDYSLKAGHIFWRLSQLVLGIAVIALYARDLNKARKEEKYSDSKWVCIGTDSIVST